MALTDAEKRAKAADRAREARTKRRAEQEQQIREESARLNAGELDRIAELAKTDPAAADEAMKVLESRQRDALMALPAAPEPEIDFNDESLEFDDDGEIKMVNVTPDDEQPATQTFVMQDPNLMRQVQGAQARHKGKSDKLDYAPNGGVYLQSDGSYVNFDGIPCTKDGQVIRS